MAAVEIAELQERIERTEDVLRGMEQRLAALEHPPVVEALPSREEEADSTRIFDFALIGRSLLIVGGAFLLRSLSETGLVPQRTGAVVALVYALGWVAIVDRGLAAGRRLTAIYDSLTAALIAGSLIWEATTRFHVFVPSVAAMLLVVAAVAFFLVASRRQTGAVAAIGAAMTILAASGLSVSTLDPLPAAIACAIVGIVALRMRLGVTITLPLAVANDLLMLTLIGTAALGRTPYPRPVVVVALLSMAIWWVAAIEWPPGLAAPVQAAAAVIIGAGGASLLALDAPLLAVLWSSIAIGTAVAGRRFGRPEWSGQSPFWAIMAMLAGFAPDARAMLLVVAAAAFAVLLISPAEASISRFALLLVITLIVLFWANGAIASASDPAARAMARSIALAVAAVLLTLTRRWPETAIMARIILVLAAFKFVLEDLRSGRATTLFAALAAYGLAMVFIARHPTVKENA